MLHHISNFFVITLVILSIVTHTFKLIYLFFEPKFLKKYKFISARAPTKTELVLYYVLIVGISVYVVNMYIIKIKTGT